MVWGLVLSGSFGDFFPGGDYVGWDERLETYFKAEMPANFRAQFKDPSGFEYVNSYMHYAAMKFIYEQGRKFPDKPALGPIEDHEWPPEFRVRILPKNLGSLIKLGDRILAVDDTLKEIINRLEPGVHQFSPIKTTSNNGKTYPKPYHTFVIRRFLDSFAPETSAPGSWERRQFGTYQATKETKEVMRGLALSKSGFKDAHIWRERNIDTPDIFFSNILHNEITSAGLRIPKHFQLREV
jgi:hypothetical protein